jgi:hypothetical protein
MRFVARPISLRFVGLTVRVQQDLEADLLLDAERIVRLSELKMDHRRSFSRAAPGRGGPAADADQTQLRAPGLEQGRKAVVVQRRIRQARQLVVHGDQHAQISRLRPHPLHGGVREREIVEVLLLVARLVQARQRRLLQVGVVDLAVERLAVKVHLQPAERTAEEALPGLALVLRGGPDLEQ